MAKDYIKDGETEAYGALVYPKVDAGTKPLPANKLLQAKAYNALAQSLADVRASWSYARLNQHDHLLTSVNVLDTPFNAVGDSKRSRCTITADAASNLTAGKRFTLYNCTGLSQAFTLYKNGTTRSSVGVGGVCQIVNGESAAQTAVRIARVINNDPYSQFRGDAYANADGTITVISQSIGNAGNITNTVESGIGGTFAVTAFTGGSTGTDDRLAILAAIAAAPTSGAGTKVVKLPDTGVGDYLVLVDATHKFEIPANTVLEFDGPNASGIAFGSTFSGDANFLTGGVVLSLKYVGSGRGEIRNGTLRYPTGNYTGSVSGPGAGSFMHGPHMGSGNQDIAFSNVRILNPTNGIFVDPDFGKSVVNLTTTDTEFCATSCGSLFGPVFDTSAQPSTWTANRTHAWVRDSGYDPATIKGHGFYLSPGNNYRFTHCTGETIASGPTYALHIYGSSGTPTPTFQDFSDCTFRGGVVNALVGYHAFRPTLKSCLFDGWNAGICVYVGDKGATLANCAFLGGAGPDGTTGTAVQDYLGTSTVSVAVTNPTFVGDFAGSLLTQSATQSGCWSMDGATFAPGCTAGAIVSQLTGVTDANIVLRNITIPASGLTDLSNPISAGTFAVLGCDLSAVTTSFRIVTAAATGGTGVTLLLDSNRHPAGISGGGFHLATDHSNTITVQGNLGPSSGGLEIVTGSRVVGRLTPTTEQGSDLTAAATVTFPGHTGRHVISGTTTIDNIVGQDNSHLALGDRMTFLFADAATTSAAGNLIPKTVAARTALTPFNIQSMLIKDGVVKAGSAVKSWVDLSASKKNFVPGTSPTIGLAQINGRNTVHFTAASSQFLQNTSFAALSTATKATYQIVVKPVGVAAAQCLIRNQNGNTIQINGSNLYITCGSDSDYGSVAYASAAARIITVVFDGTLTGDANRLKLWIDGVAQTLSFSGGGMPAALGVSSALLLGKFDPTNFLDGDLGEVNIWADALAGSDRSDVDGFTGERWGISGMSGGAAPSTKSGLALSLTTDDIFRWLEV